MFLIRNTAKSQKAWLSFIRNQIIFILNPSEKVDILKSKLFQIVVVVLCFIVFINWQKIFELYVYFKYPRPVEFHGLEIPIETGYIYNISENSIRVDNPIFNRYSITINRNIKFTTPPIESFKAYLDSLGDIVIKIENKEYNGLKYFEAYSVNDLWIFRVAVYLPEQNLLIMYQGTKMYYNTFKQTTEKIIADIDKYQ